MASHVVSVVMGGLFHAAILFLVAAGLQVVFGVQKIFNLACGSFYALGAYVGVSAVQAFIRAGGPPELFILPLAAAGLLAGLAGIPVERGLLRFVYDRDETFQLLLTFAVVLILEDLIQMTWGAAPTRGPPGRRIWRPIRPGMTTGSATPNCAYSWGTKWSTAAPAEIS